MKIRVAGITKESVVDGPGIRLVVFAQGCPHGCPDCHNPETHDFEAGQEMETGQIIQMVESSPLLSGLTFSGGEPFTQAASFAALGREVKDRGLNIMTYTGYTYEELLRIASVNDEINALLAVTDILVDGPFIVALRDLTLPFRGSRNQRIIDLPKTRACGEICEYIL